jgi:hypothetical protein
MPERPTTQDILASIRAQRPASPTPPRAESTGPSGAGSSSPPAGTSSVQEKLAAIRSASPPVAKAPQASRPKKPQVTPAPEVEAPTRPPASWAALAASVSLGAVLMTIALTVLAGAALPVLLH